MVDQQIAGAAGPADPPAQRRPPSALLARAAGGRGPAAWLTVGALPAAIVLWVLALRGARLDRMGDLGLLQVLPPFYWASFALLLAGFLAVLYRPRIPQAWAAAYVVALITVIHATPSVLYPTLRYAWAWKHVAVVDAMLRHDGTVPNAGGLEIYNEWPGFFQLNVLFLRATGLHSALGYASWWPLLTNLLLLGPLLLLYRAITDSRRLVWGGVWLFYSISWVGQDYFAPQAFVFVLFVLLLALVLGRMAEARRAAETAAEGQPASTALTARTPWLGWYAMVVVVLAGIVVSHPLTPVMTISVLAMLCLRRRNRRTVLPVLAAAVGMTFAWDVTVARPYLSQNIGGLIAGLTAAESNVRPPNQLKLGTVAPDQVAVGWLSLGMSGTIGLLALISLIGHRWVRRTGLVAVLFGPLPLLLGNGYGGEMILRAYLFVLPATAFLAATVLLRDGRRPVLHRALAAVAATVLALGMFGNYYSKEALKYFTPQEVEALRLVTTDAPAGTRIVFATGTALPGGEMHYDEDRTRIVLSQLPEEEQRRMLADPLPVLRRELTYPVVAGPSYLVLTRAQIADCRLTGVLPEDTVRRLADLAAGSPEFRAVYTGPDAVVYQYVAPSTDGPTGVAPAGGIENQPQPEERQP
ncbi:glycosyltransferase [Kitasatospora sp. NPDC085879]|uniref:glycosyltransferase n=1 Tax=Kitasatospora sp. NPDC085879 TaxID=3154769 RepID=UPI00343D6785